jgi:L-malate glycosyltransferase
MRVGVVLHSMPVAGAEMLAAEIARRLRGEVCSIFFCLDRVGPLGEQLQSEGFEVLSLGRRPGRDWRVAWRLARAADARRVELLHAHLYSPFFYAALARQLSWMRPKVILTEHGRPYPDAIAPLRRAVNRLLLDRCAAAVNAVCRYSALGLCRNDGFRGGRIEVIDNGIDVDRYAAPPDRADLRRRLGLDPARRYVAHVARLFPVKDQATLLRAFARVAPARPDVDLLIAGDGPLRGELEKQAADSGLTGRVRFLGVRSDVPDLLRSADAFALTSVSEAASLTLIEAMAAGLPIVATDVGGNPELVRPDREALLVPRGDDGATAAALGRLLDDRELAARLGSAARARAHEKFRLERTVEAYRRLYRRLCGRRADG